MEQKIIYVTIPGYRMAGLMSYFLQVISNLQVLENTSNKMYIKFDSNMLYIDNRRLDLNVWDYYFEQPFTFEYEEVKNSKIIKDVWFEGGMGVLPVKPNGDIYKKANFIANKYIKLKKYTKDKVDNFLVDNNLEKGKFLAIHKRGTDHHTMDVPNLSELKELLNIQNYFKRTDELLEKFDSILLCTDEEETVEEFKSRYGNRVKVYDSTRAPKGSKLGIHNSVGLKDPYKMGEDIVVETYLMSCADTLIRTVSNVSISAIVLNNDLNVINIDEDFNYNL